MDHVSFDHHNSFNHDHSDHDSGIHTHISKTGEIKGTSMKNVFGGKNYWDSHGVMKGMTMKNVFGGHNYHDAQGHMLGSSIPQMGHHNFLDSDGHIHQHAPSFLHSEHLNTMRTNLLNNIK